MDFGAITELLNDEDVSEIMINGWDRIFFEKKGVLYPSSKKFVDLRQLFELVSLILFEEKKDLSKSLIFNGFYKNKFRYNIVLPPMAPQGPLVTIRKFIKRFHTLDELVQQGSLSDKASLFLKKCIQSRLNIVVSGGTGTGKTSLLNTFCSLIPASQRVVTIEDVPEIFMSLPNWAQIQTQQFPNEMTARDCLVNSLRMRPDRIIIGECRRDETFEMLQAMNTGHEGSMTTIHANSGVDALSRLESLVLISGVDLPIKSIRKLISQSIHLIIQLQRLPHGPRVISEILEISGMEGDNITRAQLFVRDSDSLRPTGLPPRMVHLIERNTGAFPPRFFDPQSALKAA